MSIVTHLPAGLVLGLLLAVSPGAASAHQGGGGAHSVGVSPGIPTALSHKPSSLSLSSPAIGAAARTATGATSIPSSPGAASPGAATGGALGSPTLNIPPTSPACETAESVNCEAKIESYATVTQGDPNPPWIAPVPTTIPPTPAAPAIVEPSTDTGTLLEQSGGATQIETAGGGPTLTDCMSLWDKDVHMTKALWKTVCIRTMNGIDEPTEGLGIPMPKASAASARVHALPVARN
ncbi:hypothetical protein [Hyphomicrobium sp.]|uniref:hypothetical protein n=1 Tax=Hyphomicrobium sp. TaxID=82 RepID=UPI003F725601